MFYEGVPLSLLSPMILTPRSASTQSQGSCEYCKHDHVVLWVKLEQIGIADENRVFKFWPCSKFSRLTYCPDFG